MDDVILLNQFLVYYKCFIDILLQCYNDIMGYCIFVKKQACVYSSKLVMKLYLVCDQYPCSPAECSAFLYDVNKLIK